MKQLKLIATIFTLTMALACSKGGDSPEPSKPDEEKPIVGKVQSYTTSTSQLSLLKLKNVDFGGMPGDFTIKLDSTVLYQQMDGFGAALTGSSAYLLKLMDPDKRAAALKDLFDPNEGIGISYLRITIGSSDFSLGNYSYWDREGADGFSIPTQDSRDLIPVLKEILAINPNIKIMASPWSAPAWMKNTKTMNGGLLLDANMPAYADYFVKYIKAYKQQGINIDAISVQNEPAYQTSGYPTMFMVWQQQAMFIKAFLGPKFAAEGISTKILIWDHNFDAWDYPVNILNDPDAKKYIAGSAFHAYGGEVSAMGKVHDAHPDKDLYFTEQSGGSWGQGFAGDLVWFTKNIFIGTTNSWSKNVLLWNIALDPTNGPTNGGCTTCRGVITIDGSKVYKNVEYYAIGHFSKFVKSGAKRIGYSVVGNANVAAGVSYSTFMNPDGTKAVVVLNDGQLSVTYSISCGSRRFTYTQSGGTVVTFSWK